MNILALDLATKTGYAHGNISGDPACGTWTLAKPAEITEWGKARMDRRCDPRIPRLHAILGSLQRFDAVVFEDVEFQSYTQQCQLWSSLRAAVWIAFRDVRCLECVPVGTLKKFATGHGAATKEMMLRTLVRQNPERFAVTESDKFVLDKTTGMRLDDNAADAIHLWNWAKQNLRRIKL